MKISFAAAVAIVVITLMGGSLRVSALAAESTPTTGASPLPRLMVLDIELTGDLGGPEFVGEHEVRLRSQSAHLKEALKGVHLYEVLNDEPVASDIATLRSQQMYLHDCNGCDLDLGRKLHADQVLTPWVTRVSGLILTLTYEIHDVASGQIVRRQSFDFRGDNDAAWTHAVDYMIRHMQD